MWKNWWIFNFIDKRNVFLLLKTVCKIYVWYHMANFILYNILSLLIGDFYSTSLYCCHKHRVYPHIHYLFIFTVAAGTEDFYTVTPQQYHIDVYSNFYVTIYMFFMYKITCLKLYVITYIKSPLSHITMWTTRIFSLNSSLFLTSDTSEEAGWWVNCLL